MRTILYALTALIIGFIVGAGPVAAHKPTWLKWNGYQTGEVLVCLNATNRYPIETAGVKDENDVTIGMWVRCEEPSDTYGRK